MHTHSKQLNAILTPVSCNHACHFHLHQTQNKQINFLQMLQYLTHIVPNCKSAGLHHLFTSERSGGKTLQVFKTLTASDFLFLIWKHVHVDSNSFGKSKLISNWFYNLLPRGNNVAQAGLQTFVTFLPLMKLDQLQSVHSPRCFQLHYKNFVSVVPNQIP